LVPFQGRSCTFTGRARRRTWARAMSFLADGPPSATALCGTCMLTTMAHACGDRKHGAGTSPTASRARSRSESDDRRSRCAASPVPEPSSARAYPREVRRVPSRRANLLDARRAWTLGPVAAEPQSSRPRCRGNSAGAAKSQRA
jgi:hypothetical protein